MDGVANVSLQQVVLIFIDINEYNCGHLYSNFRAFLFSTFAIKSENHKVVNFCDSVAERRKKTFGTRVGQVKAKSVWKTE